MLDLGVYLACERLGWRAVPAVCCEWEAYAAAVLLARMEDASLEPCPVWCGDLAGFDGRPWRGAVDIAIAGLPCQPYSLAGQQLGNADERSFGDGDGPLPQYLRILSEMRPAMVFLENVPAWVVGGWFREFGEELSGLGYEIEDPLFVAAEDVGASHRRERVFLLAHCQSQRRSINSAIWLSKHDWNNIDRRNTELVNASSSRCAQSSLGREQGQTERQGRLQGSDIGRGTVGDTSRTRESADAAESRSRNSVGESGGKLADPPSGGLRELREPSGSDRQPDGSGEPVEDAQRAEPGSGIGGVESEPSRQRRDRPSDAGYELGHAERAGSQRAGSAEPERRNIVIAPDGDWPIFAPGPSDFDGWGRVVADGSFDWRAPAVKPGVRVLVDGYSLVVDQSRADQLRCIGNGCVPLQAAVAFVELVRRLNH